MSEFESSLQDKIEVEPAGKRKALGRGLAALMSSNTLELPVENEAKNTGTAKASSGSATEDAGRRGDPSLRFVALDKLTPMSSQPRKLFDESEIEELAASIRRSGVLQPILVRPSHDTSTEQFEIIAGERRYRAARRAELLQVPVIIKDLQDREVLEVSIVENVQRSALDPIEEADAYRRLRDDFSLTIEQIAESVGKDRATVSNCIRLLQLPESIRKLLVNNKLSVGHARALLSLESIEAQRGLATQIIGESLSVRAAERLVRNQKNSNKEARDSREARSAGASAEKSSTEVLALENRFRDALGTKVRLKKKKSGAGMLAISFFSDEQLNQLLAIVEREG